MNLQAPLLAALVASMALSAPVQAQDPHLIEITGVTHVTSYRGATLVLSDGAVLTKGIEFPGYGGLTFSYILAPLSEFSHKLPDSLYLPAPEGLISPIVFTAIYTTIGGIRIIIQVPCSRYSSMKACVKAFEEAVRETEKAFIRDPVASREDTTIVIPKPGK